MKILQINATYGIGSTGIIVKDIGDLLKQNGHDVRYVYQQGECDTSEGYRIGSPIDWKIHALFTRIIGMQGWGSRQETKKLLDYLKKEKPDVVHLHNLHANYINLPLLLKYLADNNIAAVVTLHDCWFFTGKCCHFTSSGCERWKTGCGKCIKKNETPKSIFFDRSSKVVKTKAQLFSKIPNLTVVGCSKWISNLAKESLVFKNSKIVQIYNGVDTTIFSPKDRENCKKKLNISTKYVILGMANKWLDEKNKEVFHAVVSHLPEEESLVLVGCTDAQKKELQKYTSVIPVGFIKDRELLAEYYNCADVFVNLTFEDTLPTVNMEALCCGAPVITYDSCGSPELVEEGKTGYVIPKMDTIALLNVWSLIKQRKVSRNECSKIGADLFKKEDRYKEYLSLFQKLIETK